MPQPPPPGSVPKPSDQPRTAFQQTVADVVDSLRPGDVLSYAEVARDAGRPGAAQAVANVLRTVPGLPWWRVIPSSGRLYRTHAPTQVPLLAAEGVAVDPQRRIVPSTADD